MKLVLIDGNSLLFRAYYATSYRGNLMTTKAGQPTNAVYALSNLLTKILADESPDYALVAFDTGAPTFRHQEYEEYKAGRKEAPEELKSQFLLARELVQNLGFFCYEKDGYEADDIIGTLAKRGSEQNLAVKIYSGDRDLLQLIDEKTTVCLTKKGVSDLQLMDETSLLNSLGLKPSQITDLKGLMGDASDNIPGVYGVGEKTALKLLSEYGSLEQVLEADIAGKLGERIKEQKEQARKSKHLATINCAVPLDFEVTALKYQGPKVLELRELYSRLEMFSLLKKIPEVEVEKTVEEIDYQLVKEVPATFLKAGLALTMAVNGNNYHRDELVGLALSDGKDSYFIASADLAIDKKLSAYLANPSLKKKAFDLKKLVVSLKRLGIELKGVDFDLLLATYLLQSSLKEEAAFIYDYYGVNLPLESSIYQKRKYDLAEVAHYSCLQVQKLGVLEIEARKQLKAIDCERLLDEIEIPVAFILAKMEIAGIRLDCDLLAKKSELISQKLESLTKEIHDLAGRTYNIQSPQQTAEILFDELKLPANRKRSTSANELSLLIDQHPIVRKILEYRQYAKLLSVYFQGLPNYVLEDGKIHTIYNQALTQTGRLSSRDPNLQNVSIRSAEGKEVRKAFVSSQDGYYILSFDYSQIELRVLAEMAQSKSLIEAFNRGADPHKETAMRIFGVKEEEVTASMRREAKIVNFGIIYGMSDWGLAEELGIDVATAKNFIRLYYEQYPEIREYFDRVIADCQENGYVKTWYGRIRYVPEIKQRNYNVREFGKRVAMNTPIQGTAADIMKLAMIKVDKILTSNKFKSRLLLQIHDELVFEVPYEELLEVIKLVKEALEDFPEFKVQLKANYNYGFSWFAD